LRIAVPGTTHNAAQNSIDARKQSAHLHFAGMPNPYSDKVNFVIDTKSQVKVR
jgi:hypothetical protein